jgi:acetyl esterase/lipase
MPPEDNSASHELQVDPDGSIHVPAHVLPPSAALSEYSRAGVAAALNRRPRVSIPVAESCETEEEFKALVDDFRADIDNDFSGPMAEHLLKDFPVEVSSGEMGGIPVEEFTPLDATDEERVLINLHGGAFCSGAIHIGRVESIPLSHLGKFRVVSVDYRQGYEHKFPAASEDVCAVYAHLLDSYSPSQIGIYGGSAGGILTAQATAWIIGQDLPVPGAIGIFGAGTGGQGDAAYFGAIGMGVRPPLPLLKNLARGSIGYFGNASDDDPMVNPTGAPLDLRAKFPPTLLITATRAFDLSPAIRTHRALIEAGVDAQLHVFDGLGHCFYYDARAPEAADAYRTMTRFFRRHLQPEHA